VEGVKKGEREREREREGERGEHFFANLPKLPSTAVWGSYLNEKKTILASLSTLNPSVIKML
jgi:hypothetical protein